MILKLSRLKQSHQALPFYLDLFMVFLVSVNLIWIIFDTLYVSQLFQSLLHKILPGFNEFYGEQVHPDFITYDLMFVTVFLVEFSLRWVVAIFKKTYRRWFFYPFIHWYDVIGCIPVGSFRWLRLLRVISILYRLQKLGVVDLQETGAGKFFLKYYRILVEEVSDRVVENVLSGVQEEVRQGTPILETILIDVLLPKRSIIANWLTVKINEICEEVYVPNQQSLKQYIDSAIADAIGQDQKIEALETVPIVGARLAQIIDNTVSDVVYKVINGLLLDIGKEETDLIVSELLDGVVHKILQPSDKAELPGREVLIEVIDVIKAQVRIQRWRELDSDYGQQH